MDEKGTLMNLSKVEDPASEYASKYLQGRQRYILVRAARESCAASPGQGLLWGQLWGGLCPAATGTQPRSSEKAEASSDEQLELSLRLSKGCSRGK